MRTKVKNHHHYQDTPHSRRQIPKQKKDSYDNNNNALHNLIVILGRLGQKQYNFFKFALVWNN